jgi:hypothetical protein
MSGFEFHIMCRACGLTSSTYPFRYDSIVGTTALELPAVSRKHASFGRISIPIASSLEEASIQRLAAENSSDDVTVLIPYFGSGAADLELRPAVECPRCRQPALEPRFGNAPEFTRPVQTVEQLIDESRRLPADVTASFRLNDAAVVRCTRRIEAGESFFDWHVARVDAADITNLVNEIIESLSRRGSTCTAPRWMRAFARFEERSR